MIQSRLKQLRQLMQQRQLAAWIIPSADPHLSEYLPEYWKARCYFSGFTGSVGTLVITAQEAGLWVDSRYWEQATQQLASTGITLQKIGQVPDYPEWLVKQLSPQSIVGIAADMLSLANKRSLLTMFAPKNIQLYYQEDLLDQVWLERPPLPKGKVYLQNARYVAESTTQKITQIRQFMADHNADYHLISSLDDIAWLTNLRGNDVPYNPIFLAHLLISQQRILLFADRNKFSSHELNALKEAGIELQDYLQIQKVLEQVTGTLLLDPAKVAMSTIEALPSQTQFVEHINPSTLFKSQKSEQEIEHIRSAMVKDGVALCECFAELESRFKSGTPTTELDVDKLLYHYRSQQEGFISPSFGTIAGFNENGAMPHYSATTEQHKTITGQGLLLIDSGAQYQCGTTDITRMIPIGEPNELQKQDYTLVLKAHIALAETVFPENIASPLLDAICRKPLWQFQRDFGHGTGHGVGYFLNVHEGPQVISYRTPIQKHHAMKVGMITSNEPGLYRAGKWGIRIESLMANRALPCDGQAEFGHYLYFETLTLCPINTQLIEVSLMTEQEKQWLNQYHDKVREALSPFLSGASLDWLLRNTQAI